MYVFFHGAFCESLKHHCQKNCMPYIGLVVKWKVQKGRFINKYLKYIFKNSYVCIKKIDLPFQNLKLFLHILEKNKEQKIKDFFLVLRYATRDTRVMRVLTKISYWIFYKTTTKYLYLESARLNLQNDEKI